jgi:hypothetical protein
MTMYPQTNTDNQPQTNADHRPQTNTDKHRSVLVRVGPWLVRSVLVCVGLWLAFLSVAAAERPHFDSTGRDGVITVDGNYDDWYGHLQPFGNDPVAIQFLNDGEFLYARLTASDPATRMQILRQGMTIWFDPAGGTKKKLGIKYPVVEGGGVARGGRGGGYGGGGGRRGEDAPDDPVAPADRVDILGPGKDDARSLTRDHLSGVDVAIRSEQGTLQYELKVPLARTADHPYAIEAAPGATIGVGLETAKMEQRAVGEGRGGGFGGGGGGGMPGGGRGRGGGGMGGRGGGGRGGDQQRGFQPPKPLKAWATLTIAPVR